MQILRTYKIVVFFLLSVLSPHLSWSVEPTPLPYACSALSALKNIDPEVDRQVEAAFTDFEVEAGFAAIQTPPTDIPPMTAEGLAHAGIFGDYGVPLNVLGIIVPDARVAQTYPAADDSHLEQLRPIIDGIRAILEEYKTLKDKSQRLSPTRIEALRLLVTELNVQMVALPKDVEELVGEAKHQVSIYRGIQGLEAFLHYTDKSINVMLSYPSPTEVKMAAAQRVVRFLRGPKNSLLKSLSPADRAIVIHAQVRLHIISILEKLKPFLTQVGTVIRFHPALPIVRERIEALQQALYGTTYKTPQGEPVDVFIYMTEAERLVYRLSMAVVAKSQSFFSYAQSKLERLRIEGRAIPVMQQREWEQQLEWDPVVREIIPSNFDQILATLPPDIYRMVVEHARSISQLTSFRASVDQNASMTGQLYPAASTHPRDENYVFYIGDPDSQSLRAEELVVNDVTLSTRFRITDLDRAFIMPESLVQHPHIHDNRPSELVARRLSPGEHATQIAQGGEHSIFIVHPVPPKDIVEIIDGAPSFQEIQAAESDPELQKDLTRKRVRAADLFLNWVKPNSLRILRFITTPSKASFSVTLTRYLLASRLLRQVSERAKIEVAKANNSKKKEWARFFRVLERDERLIMYGESEEPFIPGLSAYDIQKKIDQYFSPGLDDYFRKQIRSFFLTELGISPEEMALRIYGLEKTFTTFHESIIRLYKKNNIVRVGNSGRKVVNGQHVPYEISLDLLHGRNCIWSKAEQMFIFFDF